MPLESTCFTSGSFTFCGQQLNLRKTVSHLGHTLSCDLSDNPDIASVKKDLCRKANYMLHTFSSCDPFTMTELFRSYCLPLYGSSLWSASSKSLEVCFNNIIHKIWHLPPRCHTSILHLVAGLPSMFNTVISRSLNFTATAQSFSSSLIADIFKHSSNLVYTSTGLSCGHEFWKFYTELDILLSQFIFDVKTSPHLNPLLFNDINFICTS